jgi:hypothetical protein
VSTIVKADMAEPFRQKRHERIPEPKVSAERIAEDHRYTSRISAFAPVYGNAVGVEYIHQ